MSTTVTYDPAHNLLPRVELTKTDQGGFTAEIGIQGLDPMRGLTAEERGAGITSLNPPTVTVQARAVAYDTHRDLIRGCIRATQAAIDATDQPEATARQLGPAGLVWTGIRVSWAVRRALRLLEEDI